MSGIKARLVIAVTFTFLMVLVLFGLRQSGHQPPPSMAPSAVTRNSAYASYRFDPDEKLIHIGVQPLWVFAGNIGEVMKRDLLLAERLKELGLEARFHPFLKGDDVNFFLRRNKLQGGMCGDMPTLVIASDTDVTIPALVDRGFNAIVANRFMAVKDLKGMRIGFPVGSFSHHALMEALLGEGLDPSQVTLIPMDVTEIPEAFRQGSIDAFAGWEPMVSLALKRQPRAAVIHRSQYLGFLFFRQDFARRHPRAVREILAAEARAMRWMQQERQNVVQSSEWALEAAQSFAGIRLTLTPAEVSELIFESTDLDLDPVIPEEDLQDSRHLFREFEFLKALGYLSKTAEWKTVREKFDRTTMAEVLAHPKEYRIDQFQYNSGSPK
jgi:sulfonate transport system substrate-binding protein